MQAIRMNATNLTNHEREELRFYRRRDEARYSTKLSDKQTDFDYGQSSVDVQLSSGRWVRQFIERIPK